MLKFFLSSFKVLKNSIKSIFYSKSIIEWELQKLIKLIAEELRKNIENN